MARVSEPELGDVVALTLDGQGIAEPLGKRVLVAGALTGEQIRFRRRQRRRNYDEGVLLEIVRPAPERVVPPCTYFGVCGGCSLQHLAGPAQLALKEATLFDNLARLAGLEPRERLPALTAATLGYRRKARFGVRWVSGKGRALVGFRERATPLITDMQACATVDPRLGGLLEPLSTLIGALSIRARVPQVEATSADSATALVFRVLSPPTPADLARLLDFADAHDLQVYLQPGGTDSVHPLPGAPPPVELRYEVPEFGLSLTFGPTDFIQVHGGINRAMIGQALRLLEPTPTDRVLDLYAGIGNFTLPLATRTDRVLGLEVGRAAVERARRNAELAGLSNATFVEADLAGRGAEGAWTRERFDLAMLDPPRTGAAEVLGALARAGPRRILYVSCHPGTLARDLGVLHRDHGYGLAAAGIMDMFPHTSHVESMALLVRE
jgi:23S rRNA (uracil1939-C5)-methyltransferase